jgi:Fe-S oxidoreductase
MGCADIRLIMEKRGRAVLGSGFGGERRKVDSLDLYDDQILTCSKCGFCRAVCPVFLATLRPALNTRGKMLILKGLMSGDLELTEDLIEPFYVCTGCKACAYSCPSGIKGDEIVQAVRKRLYEKGLTPSRLLDIRHSVLEKGNVFGSQQKDRAEIYPRDVREKLAKGRPDEKAETLLFMGCLPSYMDMKIIPNLIGVMDSCNVEYATLATEEPCCGLPLYLIGSPEFRYHAEKVAEKISSSGAKEVVTPCAGCYRTLKHLYPEMSFDLGVEVHHTVQYIDGLIGEKRLRFNREMPRKVTYHDPCDLGRACKIFDEPRDVLKNIPGIELVEMEHNRFEALCCGAGGGMTGFDPDMALKMAVARVREALKSGAEIIVSSCPACKDNLRKGARAIPREERGKIKVMDITEIVANALES